MPPWKVGTLRPSPTPQGMVMLILHTGREDGARRSQEMAGSAVHLLARLPPQPLTPVLASLSRQTASKTFPQAWPPGETSVGSIKTDTRKKVVLVEASSTCSFEKFYGFLELFYKCIT